MKSFIQKTQDKALKILGDKRLVSELVKKASAKAEQNKSKIKDFWGDLKALLRLTKAWAKGQYRQVPWKSLIGIITALIYFLNPFDFIPDFLSIIGFLDDAIVVGFVISSVRADIQKFLKWEESRS